MSISDFDIKEEQGKVYIIYTNCTTDIDHLGVKHAKPWIILMSWKVTRYEFMVCLMKLRCVNHHDVTNG
jgi:hypothetical protein